MQSMSVSTLDSRVGCMKEPSSLFPPRTMTAPCATASAIWFSTWKKQQLINTIKPIILTTWSVCVLVDSDISVLYRHLLCGAGVDERPLCGGGLWAVAKLQFGIHSLRQLFHKSIMDPTLYQKAVGAHAGLQQRDTLQVRNGEQLFTVTKMLSTP